MSFSIINQIFLIFWWVSKNSLFLTTWPRKHAPPKHYKNRGFSTPIFEKQLCVTKRPFLDKKTQIQKIQLSFCFAYFLCCLCVRIDCAQCRSRMEWTSSTNVCKITPGGASTAVFLLHSCPWSLEPYRAAVNIHMLSIHRSRLQAASLDTPPSRACGVSIHIEKSKLGIPNSHFPTQLNSARFWHRDITT